MQGHVDTVAGVTLSGGSITGYAGSIITIGDASLGIRSTEQSVIDSSQLSLPNQTTVEVANGRLDINADITSGGIVFQGGGILSLNGTNSFNGGTTIGGGALFAGDSGLGTGDVHFNGGKLVATTPLSAPVAAFTPTAVFRDLV